jgi:hypothetical protein
MVEVETRIALGMGEGELERALCDLRHPFGALLGRAAEPQEAAAQDHGGEIGFQRQHPAKRFHHDHRLDGPATDAAVFLRKRQRHQPHLGIVAPHGSAPARVRFQDAVALLEPVFVGQKPVERILQDRLFLGKVKIHRLS